MRQGGIGRRLQPAKGSQVCNARRFQCEDDFRNIEPPDFRLLFRIAYAPIPPKHGAPLRLVIPFRYGVRSVKAITEIGFGITIAAPPKPA